MSFNKPIRPVSVRTGSEIVNDYGGKAFTMTPEMELYSLVCTSMMDGKDNPDKLQRIDKLMGKVSHQFVAQLAVYARNILNLRSIPIVLAVKLAKIHSGDNLVSKLISGIVNRPDEITELLSFYQLENGRGDAKKLGKLSNQVAKGIRDIFESGKFNEYQFAKYNNTAKDVKLRDAIFLSHPKPRWTAQKELFEKIINNTMEVPYTWETQLSKAGQADSPATTKKAVWEELIDAGTVGYMALLRNLRNILQAGVDTEHLSEVCSIISDRAQVLRSKQLPFRFLSAYRSLIGFSSYYASAEGIDSSNSRCMVIVALEIAIKHSFENMTLFGDNDASESQLIAIDVSGSMMEPVSQKSTIELFDIGTLMALMASYKLPNSTTGMFGDKWKTVKFGTANILEETDKIRKREGEVGYSTNGYKVLEWAIQHNKKFDRILFFTDEQMYNTKGYRHTQMVDVWAEYSKMFPESRLYIFDLKGRGQTPLDIRDDRVTKVAGWSNTVFDAIQALENGADVIDQIKSIYIPYTPKG